MTPKEVDDTFHTPKFTFTPSPAPSAKSFATLKRQKLTTKPYLACVQIQADLMKKIMQIKARITHPKKRKNLKNKT